MTSSAIMIITGALMAAIGAIANSDTASIMGSIWMVGGLIAGEIWKLRN